MTMILMAALVLGGLGLLFGLLLTLANKVFEVPSDPRRDAVRNCLPGANCGGCGYSGCAACAQAIVNGQAKVNACPVGGEAAANAIAAVMGVSADQAARLRAQIICRKAEIPLCRRAGLCRRKPHRWGRKGMPKRLHRAWQLQRDLPVPCN